MKKYLISAFITAFLFSFPAKANGLPDADGDGVPDFDEINVYMTDPNNADTDEDGFNDWVELNSGYSPHNPKKIKLEDNDNDNDGLKDRMELKFRTDLSKPDTDGDGIFDGEEIKKYLDPLNSDPSARLVKRIEINTGKVQEMSYFLGDVKMGTYKVSTGKRSMPTPKGTFKVLNKSPKAWSKMYGLWMPYWVGLGKFGIHELPIWPSGYREGEDHLGKPVSHGCIRLGIGSAKVIYDFAEVGDEVYIY